MLIPIIVKGNSPNNTLKGYDKILCTIFTGSWIFLSSFKRHRQQTVYTDINCCIYVTFLRM